VLVGLVGAASTLFFFDPLIDRPNALPYDIRFAQSCLLAAQLKQTDIFI